MITRIIHDGTEVKQWLSVSDTVQGGRLVAVTRTKWQQFDKPTHEEALAEITRLNLIYTPTIGAKLARAFSQLPPETQAKYQEVYAPITALLDAGKTAEAKIAFEAVTVAPEDQAAKDAMLKLFP